MGSVGKEYSDVLLGAVDIEGKRCARLQWSSMRVVCVPWIDAFAEWVGEKISVRYHDESESRTYRVSDADGNTTKTMTIRQCEFGRASRNTCGRHASLIVRFVAILVPGFVAIRVYMESGAVTHQSRASLSSTPPFFRERVEAIHRRSRSTYGRRRIHAELADEGIRVGSKRVARLMRSRSIHGASRRKTIMTTIRDRDARPAPDLVERRFAAKAPNQLWVADITYVPTWGGFLYLAVVLDALCRRVVGWAMADHMRKELVLDAAMAIYRRKPLAVVHHSDQGSQYTSIAFALRCKAAGIRPSMGSRGDCYDNAMCESVNATLECELLVKKRFQTQREAEAAVFAFIEARVEIAPSPFRPWLSLADQLRAASTDVGLKSKPKTIHGIGSTPLLQLESAPLSGQAGFRISGRLAPTRSPAGLNPL